MPMRSVSHKREITVAPQHPYTETYIESCFWAWYNAGQPVGTKFVSVVPADEGGRVPSLILLNRWKKENGWEDRARELNNQVTREIEKRTVQARVEMLDRHAKMAREMSEQGMAFLEKQEIDTAAAAIRAITEGIRIERESVGIGTAIKDIAKKNNDQLIDIITNLLEKSGKSDTVDPDSIIDGEFSEVEDTDDE